MRQAAELTGCPFSDAHNSGLKLDPQAGGGLPHLEGDRLVWDATRRVARYLPEMAEQVALFRARRGLHIVRPLPPHEEGPHDDREDTTVHALDRSDDLAVANDTSGSKRLRTGTAAAAAAARVQGDATDVRLRQARKLPLGV